MAIDISRIRNIGFVGHGGVGKTSLVEAILFRNGMTSRLGRVDDGTATTDFDPEEVKRKISINIGVAHCDYRDHRFHLVDMPGYGDFIAEARAGLRVVEGAVLVVDAVAGVEVQTEKVSKFAQEYGLPRLVFVNRMDRERADFDRTLESIQRRLKGRFVPLHVPIGQETGFRGLVDVLRMKGYVLGDAPGKIEETDIPADLAETVQATREKLVEAVAETDDDLLARYLEEGTLDEADVIKAIRAAIADGKLVPVILGSATKAIGVRLPAGHRDRLLPVPGRPAAGRGDRSPDQGARDARAQPEGALRRAGLQDPHRSPRRQAHALPRLLRHPHRELAGLQRRRARRASGSARWRCSRAGSTRRSTRSAPARSASS